MKFPIPTLFVLLYLAPSVKVAVAKPESRFTPEIRTVESSLEPQNCDINVCFAIDGSSFVSGKDFKLQKVFIANVVEALSSENDLEVAAVQYGISNNVISPLTTDVPAFLKELRKTRFSRTPRTFISGGIVYCHSQLRRNPEDSDKMVILGSGQSDLGGDPETRAKAFRDSGGKILAVGIGKRQDLDALHAVAGNASNVFSIREKTELESLVSRFIEKLCH